MSIFKPTKKPKTVAVASQTPTPRADKPLEHTSRFVRPVLERTHESERAYRLGSMNQYVFSVTMDANKPLIKRDVEHRYNVKVQAVNTVRIKGKLKRAGIKLGRRAGLKKAIVTLKPGYKIETT